MRVGDVSRGKALLLRSLQSKIDRHGKKSPMVAAAMVRRNGEDVGHVCEYNITHHTFQVSIAAVLDAAKAKEFLTKALAILEAAYGRSNVHYVDVCQ